MNEFELPYSALKPLLLLTLTSCLLVMLPGKVATSQEGVEGVEGAAYSINLVLQKTASLKVQNVI